VPFTVPRNAGCRSGTSCRRAPPFPPQMLDQWSSRKPGRSCLPRHGARPRNGNAIVLIADLLEFHRRHFPRARRIIDF
jgi:hypothetical protein